MIKLNKGEVQRAQRWLKKVKPKRGKTTSKNRSYFVPKVNDDVLVTFEPGNIKKPIVIGSMWNKTNKPPDTTSKKATKKMIKKNKTAKTRTRLLKKSTSTKTKKT
jgi:phage baseplate assembly protein gpV